MDNAAMSNPLIFFQPAVDFTFIITCYFEEKSIDEFHSRLSKTLQSLGRSYEIVFVNDGSTDGTFERLRQIYERDPNVVAVFDLMKNTGQANAKTPGIMLGRGKAFVLIDSDLQLDPEDFPSLVAKYDEGYEIVTGYRESRSDALRRTLPSRVANVLMRVATRSRIRDFGCTFKIYDGRLVRAFEFGPTMPWRLVPVISAAQRIAEVPVNHHPRRYGKSGWTFRKLFAHNMDTLVNLSERPFQFIAALCMVLSFLFVLRVAVGFVIPGSVLPRVTEGLVLNVLVVCFLVLLAVLCAVGEFVIRNFNFLQRHPAFVVREVLTRLPLGGDAGASAPER